MTEAVDMSTRRSSRILSGLAIGIAAALLGLLPWLATGAALPLQNLWESNVLPENMPLALLPVSQYSAVRIVALLVTGGVIAGLATRLLRSSVGAASLAAAVGVLLVHAVAVVQSFIVVADGLGLGRQTADTRALLYLGGMLGGTVLAGVLAQAAFWLASRRAIGPASLGLTLSAVLVTSWVTDAVSGLSGPADAPALLSYVSRWLPAVLVGVVLGWCGIRPLRRLAVWAVSLAVLWITPAFLTAVSYALGMRVLDGDLWAMAEAATQVFPLALGIGTLPVLLAFVIGVVLAGIRFLTRRKRDSERVRDRDREEVGQTA
ncbi:hypothetical protein IWX78_000171 [Mycetocola sp. CAN_C7]|uniref:hypothetical protein n=1 Tax=Mycetocola sp. CAN_C7 TaxID=2787724 RepID=UPI0018C920F6